MLVEVDHVPIELQLSLYAKLHLPIAAIVLSGGRSAHAWVKLDASTLVEFQQEAGKLLRLVARFGIDQQNKNASRMSRFPGGQRVIGASGDGLQRLIYLNPNPTPKSIL
jgi:hypothetical protein